MGHASDSPGTSAERSESMKLKAFFTATLVGVLTVIAISSGAAGDVQLGPVEATGAGGVRVPKDFKLDMVYLVPKATQGSWVAMCFDPQGRLIVSDQNGALHRVTLPQEAGGAVKTEKIDLDIGGAHGLLYAFDSLYVVVNEGRKAHGLYRVRDTDGDDKFDKVELLRQINAGGEHGAHSLIPSPDGKSLYFVAGNASQLTKVDSSRAPKVWGEDDLL